MLTDVISKYINKKIEVATAQQQQHPQVAAQNQKQKLCIAWKATIKIIGQVNIWPTMSRDDTRSLTKFDYPSTVTDDLAKSLKFRFFKASSDKKYTETRFSIKYFSIGHFRTVQ